MAKRKRVFPKRRHSVPRTYVGKRLAQNSKKLRGK